MELKTSGIAIDPGLYQKGDLVVGGSTPESRSFREDGTRTKSATVIGTKEDVDEMTERYTRTALSARNSSMLPPVVVPAVEPIMPAKLKKRGRPYAGSKKEAKELAKKAKETQPVQTSGYMQVVNQPVISAPFAQTVTAQQFTYSELAQGTLPIDVVFSNRFGKITLSVESILDDETSLCLVFANERELKFIPAIGEQLEIVINGREAQVVYYPGFMFSYNSRKLMVLAKVPKEDENG